MLVRLNIFYVKTKQGYVKNHNSTCHLKRNSECSIGDEMLEVICVIYVCSIFSFGNIFHPILRDAGKSIDGQ